MMRMEKVEQVASRREKNERNIKIGGRQEKQNKIRRRTGARSGAGDDGGK